MTERRGQPGVGALGAPSEVPPAKAAEAADAASGARPVAAMAGVAAPEAAQRAAGVSRVPQPDGAAVLARARALGPAGIARAPEELVEAAMDAELGGTLPADLRDEAVVAVTALLRDDPRGQALLAALAATDPGTPLTTTTTDGEDRPC